MFKVGRTSVRNFVQQECLDRSTHGFTRLHVISTCAVPVTVSMAVRWFCQTQTHRRGESLPPKSRPFCTILGCAAVSGRIAYERIVVRPKRERARTRFIQVVEGGKPRYFWRTILEIPQTKSVLRCSTFHRQFENMHASVFFLALWLNCESFQGPSFHFDVLWKYCSRISSRGARVVAPSRQTQNIKQDETSRVQGVFAHLADASF